MLQANAATDPLYAVGWQTCQTLEGVLESTPMTTVIQDLLAAQHIVLLGAAGTKYTVADAANWL